MRWLASCTGHHSTYVGRASECIASSQKQGAKHSFRRCVRFATARPERLFLTIRCVVLRAQMKILIALYQMVVSIPKTYQVKLPPEYYTWMEVFRYITLPWDQFVIPGDCLPGGLAFRLLLRGSLPLVLIAMVIPLDIARVLIVRLIKTCCGRGSEEPLLLSRIFNESVPYMLFIAFVFCVSVSSGLFAAWSCDYYEVDRVYAADGTYTQVMKGFLRDDLNIECDGSDPAYQEINRLCWIFIAIWPIGVPITYLLFLIPNRRSILEKRSTRSVRATAFLHREYDSSFFWWEPFYLVQRLLVVGFLQWIPSDTDHPFGLIRLTMGQVVALLYMIVLMFVKPYKRFDMGVLAISAQLSIVAIFYGASYIKLWDMLEMEDPGTTGTDSLTFKITGFTQSWSLALLVFSFNVFSIVVFLAITVYHMHVRRDTQSIRRSDNGELPELTLLPGMKYHVFISHIWSSGQDQGAS